MAARKLTVEEAVTTLAALVARLAAGCWPDLGTAEAKDIAERADEVFKAMVVLPKPRRRVKP